MPTRQTTILAMLAAVLCLGGSTAKGDSFGISISYRSRPIVIQTEYGHGYYSTSSSCYTGPHHGYRYEGRRHSRWDNRGHRRHWGHRNRYSHRPAVTATIKL